MVKAKSPNKPQTKAQRDQQRYHTLLQYKEWDKESPGLFKLKPDDLAFMSRYERTQRVKAEAAKIKEERALQTAEKKLGKRRSMFTAMELTEALKPKQAEKPKQPKPKKTRLSETNLQKRELATLRAAATIQADKDTQAWSEAIVMARELALAAFPRRKTSAKIVSRILRLGERMWARVDYSVTKGELPYGQDRLALAAVITQITQAHRAKQENPWVVEFESAGGLLRAFGINWGGGRPLARLREAFARLRRCNVEITYAESEVALSSSEGGEGFRIIRGWALPSEDDLEHEESGLIRLPFGPGGFRIIASKDFGEYVVNPRNQVLMPAEVMRVFSDEPAGLDLAWIVITRCTHAKSESAIPHEALIGAFRDGKEEDRNVISRLQGYLNTLHQATGGRLNARFEEIASVRSGGRGRPSKRWALKVGPSGSLVTSGKGKLK